MFVILFFIHVNIILATDCSPFSPVILQNWVFDEKSIFCEDTAKELFTCRIDYFRPRSVICQNFEYGSTNITDDNFWNLDGIVLHWECEPDSNVEVLLVCPKTHNLCDTDINDCKIVYNPLLQILWYTNIGLLISIFIIFIIFSIIVCYMTHCSFNFGANFGRRKYE